MSCPEVTCGCGVTFQITTDKFGNTCKDCRRYDAIVPTEDDALPPGEWVRKGLTQVWVEKTYWPIELLPPHANGYTIRTTCDDCGCLCLPREDCPMCLWNSINEEERAA